MVKIDHLKIIWSSFSNKPLKFGQILIQKLLGFSKNETNGKVDVQIKKNYGFDMKQHLVRSIEQRDFWSVLWRKIKFQHKTSFIFLFYCVQFYVKLAKKWRLYLRFYLASKIKLADDLMS